MNDIPEVGGAVGTCTKGSKQQGPHYCNKKYTCEKCPSKLQTKEQRENCFAGQGRGG
jgi:hypothetical protein